MYDRGGEGVCESTKSRILSSIDSLVHLECFCACVCACRWVAHNLEAPSENDRENTEFSKKFISIPISRETTSDNDE